MAIHGSLKKVVLEKGIRAWCFSGRGEEASH